MVRACGGTQAAAQGSRAPLRRCTALCSGGEPHGRAPISSHRKPPRLSSGTCGRRRAGRAISCRMKRGVAATCVGRRAPTPLPGARRRRPPRAAAGGDTASISLRRHAGAAARLTARDTRPNTGEYHSGSAAAPPPLPRGSRYQKWPRKPPSMRSQSSMNWWGAEAHDGVCVWGVRAGGFEGSRC